MATAAVLRTLITLFSIPFIAMSRLAEAIDLWDLRSDIAICIATVDRFKRRCAIPSAFIQALIVGEDHRNSLHYGVDPLGMIRAVLALITGSGIQGASTIEQQFVRVVTNCYERTVYRKIREQALAIALAHRRSKFEICTAYLCVASYGHDLAGLSGIVRLCGDALDACPPQKIHAVIARLKYPQPSGRRTGGSANSNAELATFPAGRCYKKRRTGVNLSDTTHIFMNYNPKHSRDAPACQLHRAERDERWSSLRHRRIGRSVRAQPTPKP